MRISRRSFRVDKLFEWIWKQSTTVKILLTVVILISALVVVSFIWEYHNFLLLVGGESIHALGIIVLIYKLRKKKTCSGLSLKTQCINAVFLGGKAICLLSLVDNLLELPLLAAFFATCWVIYMMKGKLKSTYNRELDNLSVLPLVVPVAILAIVIHPKIDLQISIPWAFSQFLSSVSMLPQLRLMQNAKMVEPFTAFYVFALGVSRFLRFGYWIIMVYNTGGTFLFFGGYRSLWSAMDFLSEFVHSFILADFCYYYVKSVIHNQKVMELSSVH